MKNEVSIDYKSIEDIKSKIDQYYQEYFNQIFGLNIDPTLITSGLKISKLKGNDKNTLSSIITEWNKSVEEYKNSFDIIFNSRKLSIYEDIPDDFKNKQFRYNLWTVSAAMKTKDPDLARYKKDFAEALPEDILLTLKLIMEEANNYVSKVSYNIDLDKIENIEDLKFDFLDKEELSLKKIIGYGIRSEILHRMYPSIFPIMTQRSLWGMYFLTSLEKEFITIEEKTRKHAMRVSHNWTYDYARFTFYNNYIYMKLDMSLKNYDIKLDNKKRFGYCNMFLVSIAKIHKSEIKDVHEWSEDDNKFH